MPTIPTTPLRPRDAETAPAPTETTQAVTDAAPAATETTPAANETPPTPPTKLTLEARLAATTAQMTLRLEYAALAHAVNTAHLPTPTTEPGDTIPLTPTLQPAPTPYPTPVAALLQRAHHRLLTTGWCAGTRTDPSGALCLYGAIHTEAAGNHQLETSGMKVLMDTIRREFGDLVDSIPAFNDAFATSRVPLRALDRAALLADTRGL
ncbi:hypothetical protein ACFXHD_00015 [Streptomyces hydrogenans]|uniref:DUF6197 family protein n=1 Tax=Streptomyces hydrogenans TaxID=1873719 RepID=UPI00369FC62E